MSDSLAALMETDRCLDEVAARRTPSNPDSALGAMVALAQSVDDAPLPALPPEAFEQPLPATNGARRVALGLVAASVFSSSGIAAAVTGDPFLPFQYVAKKVYDIGYQEPRDRLDWQLGQSMPSDGGFRLHQPAPGLDTYDDLPAPARRDTTQPGDEPVDRGPADGTPDREIGEDDGQQLVDPAPAESPGEAPPEAESAPSESATGNNDAQSTEPEPSDPAEAQRQAPESGPADNESQPEAEEQDSTEETTTESEDDGSTEDDPPPAAEQPPSSEAPPSSEPPAVEDPSTTDAPAEDPADEPSSDDEPFLEEPAEDPAADQPLPVDPPALESASEALAAEEAPSPEASAAPAPDDADTTSATP